MLVVWSELYSSVLSTRWRTYRRPLLPVRVGAAKAVFPREVSSRLPHAELGLELEPEPWFLFA